MNFVANPPEAADVISWTGVAGAAVAVGLSIWNKLHIRRIDVKLDGMLKYRSRADIAEATVKEKNDVRDRADLKEKESRL